MKKLVVMALAAMLIFTACAGGTAKSEASAASAVSSSKTEKKEKNAIDPAIDQEKLIAEIEKNGGIKVKNCKFEGSDFKGKCTYTFDTYKMNFHNVKLTGAVLANNKINTFFTANIEGNGFYMEGTYDINADLTVNGSEYEFKNVYTSLPSEAVKHTTPFTTDMLYDNGYFISIALTTEEVETLKDKLCFDESITIEDIPPMKYAQKAVIIPINHNTVKSIELLPYDKEDSTIRLSPFEAWATFKFTFKNDVVFSIAEGLKYSNRDDKARWWLLENTFGYRAGNYLDCLENI